jgi:hypothetical protein
MSSPMKHFRALLLLTVMLGAHAAVAQQPERDNLAVANALFVEGKQLLAADQVAEACARFAASLALLPRLGVRLNLADCYQRQGKTASAWVLFGEAAALAHRNADPREVTALERQAALLPRLSRLRIVPSDRAIEGVIVKRDGVRVVASELGVAVPVDPGAHVVEASAPDRLAWSTHVNVPEGPATVVVVVPELERRAPAPGVERDRGRPLAPRVWIAGAIGAAGLGLGTAFGLSARTLWREAEVGCNDANVCTGKAYEIAQRSHRDGTVSTISFAIGGAAVLTAVILYLRTPRDRGRSLQLTAAIAPHAGLSLAGAF